MNRYNFGNVTTNGMQILSVGSTTASRVFRDKADSSLNNLGTEQKTQKISNESKIMQNLSEEEQSKYYQMKADKRKSQIEKWENKPKSFAIEENSEQAKALNTRFANDTEWQDTIGVRFTNKATGRMVSQEEALKLLINKNKNKEGGNE